jgi:hypothetical protein
VGCFRGGWSACCAWTASCAGATGGAERGVYRRCRPGYALQLLCAGRQADGRVGAARAHPNSATEFNISLAFGPGIPDEKLTFKFTVDAAGRGASLMVSTQPEEVFHRTGEAAHHVFHDYQRSEAMIPMRDGVKLHIVYLKPADIGEPCRS